MSEKKPYFGQLVKVGGNIERRGCGSNPRDCEQSVSNMGCYNCNLTKHDRTTRTAVLNTDGKPILTTIENVFCAFSLPTVI